MSTRSIAYPEPETLGIARTVGIASGIEGGNTLKILVRSANAVRGDRGFSLPHLGDRKLMLG